MAGHAGRQVQAARGPGPAICASSSTHQRPRADEAHLAAPDVEELRELVERGAAQQPPDARDARVVGDLEQALGLVEVHAGRPCAPRRRATIERNLRIGSAAVAADARLAEEHRPARVEPDREGDRRPSRRERRAAAASRRARSNARLTQPRGARAARSAARRASSGPSTWSNSTDEPTTSNSRGSTLTRTPTELRHADELEHVRGVGAARRDDHAVDRGAADERAERVSSSRRAAAGWTGRPATTSALTWLVASLRASAADAPRVADHEAALGRGDRGARRGARPCGREEERGGADATGEHHLLGLRRRRRRAVVDQPHDSAKRPEICSSAGASSSVVLFSTSSSRS